MTSRCASTSGRAALNPHPSVFAVQTLGPEVLKGVTKLRILKGSGIPRTHVKNDPEEVVFGKERQGHCKSIPLLAMLLH